MNEFNLIGVLKSVLPLEETASGIKVINFIVEVDRPFKSDKKDLFKVTAFKDIAEDFASRTIIGSNILISGRLQSNNYEKDDKVYYSPELLADKIYYVVK